ncbi:MAG TPA: hypothetical protein VLE97_01850 [Gaiellaceae bacterium]|nr:hypothetical protein [Gaiellaceae bacterium]
MARRHAGIARFRGLNPDNSELTTREGRRLLGHVMRKVEAGVAHPKLTKQLPDGTILVAQFDGTTPMVTVIQPQQPVERPRAPDKADLFIPKGFVLYPANNAVPSGWGLPIVPNADPDIGPYDKTNRAPGLDLTRWTEGGALGQVLVTRETGGGYAEKDADLVIPLLYAPDVALRPLPGFTLAEPGSVFAAFRIEFADFTAQSPSAGAVEQANLVLQKRYIFENVNTKRTSVGRDPIALPIRGLYDGAQTAAEIMFATDVLGHFSAAFPWPYQTAEDRLAKEGFRSYGIVGESNSRNHNHGENAIATALSATETGLDPDGTPIYDIVPGPDIDGPTAFAGWLASPPHLAMMIATQFDKAFATTTVGFKGAFATQHFNHHTQWIETGNRFWRSSNADVPTLSWFAPPQLNLAWETWPVAIDNSSPTTPPSSDPLIILSQLTDVAGDHLFWLREHYGQETVAVNGNDLDFRNLTVPAYDSRIFCRGRAIAIVPNDGWVWAASIIKYDSPDSNLDNVYRLVALTHQESDQPGDQKVNGMTRYLRVWYCDLPNDAFLPSNPHCSIKGIFGSESEGWPWDRVDSPFSWQGGDMIDLATTDLDSLKYASQWVFNAAGDRAVCLRDKGVYTDYAGLYVSEFQASMAQANGLPPIALELVFGGNAFNPLTTTLNRFAAPVGETPQDLDVGDPFGPWKIITTPLAAGYGAADQLRFCFVTSLINPFNTNPHESSTYRASFEFSDDYDFAPADTTGIRFSTAIARPMDDELLPFVYMPSCLDVRDEVVLCYGIIQRYKVEPDFSSGANEEFDACWIGTSNPNIRIMGWRNGTRVIDDSYGNPDGTVYSLYALCFQTSPGGSYYWIGMQLPLSQSQMMLPSYARSGEDWMLSYVMQPQPDVLYRVVTPSTDCDIFSDSDTSCSPTPASTLTTLLEGHASCRGGNTTSSLGNSAAIADMTQTTGAGARFLYARSV